MKQYFRTIGSIVAISAMIVFASSCKKDTLSEEAQKLIPGVERNISASATLPQDADKAHIDGSRKVIWDMGDELNINGTNVAISRIVSGGTVAKFDKSTVHANTVSGTDHYWAVYPTTLAGAYSGGLPSEFSSTTSLTVNFPDTQIVDIRAADTLNGITYMASHVAVAPGTEDVLFPMRNLGAVLELDLRTYCSNAASRVDSIVFTSSNASLAGTFTVSADATNPTITSTAGTNKLVVKFRDGSNKYIDITDGKKVCVILPPLSSKNLNMKIYGTNAKYTEKNATSVTLARNNFYSSLISNVAFGKSDVVGFSVAADRRVLFSPGNLQYQAYGSYLDADVNLVGGTWRFAPNQWDYIGNAVGNNTYSEANRSTQSDWIDLFGWGTSGWNSGAQAYLPYTTNKTTNRYHPGGHDNTNLTDACARADWGVYNAIYNTKTNSTDPAGTWRTLTNDEWFYLIFTRKIIVDCNATNMYGQANVNGVNGLVILPDNWDPASCPDFVYDNSVWANIFDETTNPKWSQMEALGCVFLPAAGWRSGASVGDAGSYGYYWSSTFYRSIYAYQLHFDNGYLSGYVYPSDYGYRHIGNSVRLVKDVH